MCISLWQFANILANTSPSKSKLTVSFLTGILSLHFNESYLNTVAFVEIGLLASCKYSYMTKVDVPSDLFHEQLGTAIDGLAPADGDLFLLYVRNSGFPY